MENPFTKPPFAETTTETEPLVIDLSKLSKKEALYMLDEGLSDRSWRVQLLVPRVEKTKSDTTTEEDAAIKGLGRFLGRFFSRNEKESVEEINISVLPNFYDVTGGKITLADLSLMYAETLEKGVEFITGLSPENFLKRFGGGTPERIAKILADKTIRGESTAIAAFNQAEDMIGSARYSRVNHSHLSDPLKPLISPKLNIAESAIVVADEYQRAGVGVILTKIRHLHALHNNVDGFYIVIKRSNSRPLENMRKSDLVEATPIQYEGDQLHTVFMTTEALKLNNEYIKPKVYKPSQIEVGLTETNYKIYLKKDDIVSFSETSEDKQIEEFNVVLSKLLHQLGYTPEKLPSYYKGYSKDRRLHALKIKGIKDTSIRIKDDDGINNYNGHGYILKLKYEESESKEVKTAKIWIGTDIAKTRLFVGFYDTENNTLTTDDPRSYGLLKLLHLK